MTALDLIESIFARPQDGPRDISRITPEQLAYVRDLVMKDPQAARVCNGQGGSLVWSPKGMYRYVLTEDTNGGKRHTLARIVNGSFVGQQGLF